MAGVFGPRSGVRLSGGLGGPHYGRLTVLTLAPDFLPRGDSGGEARRGVGGVWWWGRRAGRARQGRDRAKPEPPHVYSDHDACGPPNGVRISRAATIDRDGSRARATAKMRTILWPRSGVGLHARVGRFGLCICVFFSTDLSL